MGLAGGVGWSGSLDVAPRMASAPAAAGHDPPPSNLLSVCPSAPPATMSLLAGAMGGAWAQQDSVLSAGAPSAPLPPPGGFAAHVPLTPALGGAAGVRPQSLGMPSAQEEVGGSGGTDSEREGLGSAGSAQTERSGASSALANDPLLSWVNSQLASGASPFAAVAGLPGLGSSSSSGLTPDTRSVGSAGPGTPAADVAGAAAAQEPTQLAAGGPQHTATGMSSKGSMAVDIQPW